MNNIPLIMARRVEKRRFRKLEPLASRADRRADDIQRAQLAYLDVIASTLVEILRLLAAPQKGQT